MNTPERYNGSLTLRRKLGMRGYGVYSRLVELIVSAPQKRVKYDLDDLSFDMNEDPDFIKSVIEDFDLIDVKEDGFLEDPYTKTPEAIEKERQEQIKINRSIGAQKAAATRKANKEAREALAKQESSSSPAPTPTLAPPSKPTPVTFNPVEEEPAGDAKLFERVVEEWNRLFKRSRRGYTDLAPSPIVWFNFTESAKRYELNDFIDAFKQAKTESFTWLFQDVIKPSNMQRLLSNYEAETTNKAKNEKLDFETQEMIDYAKSRGLCWND